jgi:RimJ/RimL family protein N-acetyltransferase
MIALRELSRADLPTLNAWRNDPEVIAHLGANFRFIDLAVDERWYEAYMANRDKQVRLAIVDAAADRLIGFVYLTEIHPINRTGEFAIFIGDKASWSRGFGEAATRRMLAHAFEDLNLNRIHLTVQADNERAIRLYEKVGFSVEGRHPEAVYKQGRFVDMIAMGMLKRAYFAAVSTRAERSHA